MLDTSTSSVSTTPVFEDPKAKLISLYYGIFAVFGFFHLFGFASEALSDWRVIGILALLLIQVGFMLYGAWLYWFKKTLGLKILFWVSLSLIPSIMTPLFIYIPKVTTGFLLFFQMTEYTTNLGFDFHFFYNSSLRILNDYIWGFGINVIEFFIFIRFKYLAETQGVKVSLFK